jgi:foldase protein PrsA
LQDRWSAWQDAEPNAQTDKRSQQESPASDRASERAARAVARDLDKELSRAERAERARQRRERKEIARSQAVVERDMLLDRARGAFKAARRSLVGFREEGVVAVVRAAYRRRWVAVTSIIVLAVGSGLAGALAMRAKTRSYNLATLVAVNGRTITRLGLTDELKARYGKRTLDEMVEREVRRQFLAKKGATATEQQIADRLRLESAMPSFLPTLQRVGKAESEYRVSLARSLGELNLVSQGVSITDEEKRAFYEANVDPRNVRSLFYTPDVVTVAVIATASRTEADKAVSAIQRGAEWAAVARQYSVDDTAQGGGLMAPFAIGRSLTARATGVDAIARRLKAGDQAGPVQAGPLWWVVRCLERTPAQTRTYEEVRATVNVLARAAKGEALHGRRLAEEYATFRRTANIQVFQSQ